MDRTDSEQKCRWGQFAYLANAIREGGNIRNVPHQITLDGVRSTTEAALVLIANFGRVPAGLKVRGGSVVGRTMFTASIRPAALTVMVPRR